MKTTHAKQIHAYVLDLSKIKGEGDFLCPRCGNKISPEDETEEAYSILEAKVNGCGLEEVIICCIKCSSQITLTGFSIIQKLSEMDEKELRQKYLKHDNC